MESFPVRSWIRWPMAVIAVFFLACCGGDNGNTASDTVFTENNSLPNNVFITTLNGLQAEPSNSSAATGAGTLIIDPATRLVRATIVTSGIAGIAAHIHEGPSGVGNPSIFPLAETAPGSGIWSTQATLTEAQSNTLRTGNFYFDVHATLPNSDIRGQILQQPSTAAVTALSAGRLVTFIDVLTGTQQVPPRASTASAMGIAIVDTAAKTLAASITTIGIAGTEAHIHEGVPGRAGPVIFALAQTSTGSGIWFTKAGLSDAQINAIMGGDDYFDVHSISTPEGEIRGQIVLLNHKTGFDDCRFLGFRFGGFARDDCGFDRSGFFIGLGVGFGGFGFGGFAFDSF